MWQGHVHGNVAETILPVYAINFAEIVSPGHTTHEVQQVLEVFSAS